MNTPRTATVPAVAEPIAAEMEKLKVGSNNIAPADEVKESTKNADTKLEVVIEKAPEATAESAALPTPALGHESQELAIQHPDSSAKVEASESETGTAAAKAPVLSEDAAEKKAKYQINTAGSTVEIAVAPSVRNPHFDAFIRSSQSEYEEKLTHMAVDIDKGQLCDHYADMCVVCDKSGVLSCGRCKCARYCSQECQKSDWPYHKKVCDDFKGDTSEASRPSPEHRRVLYFPAYSEEPRLLWGLPKEDGKRKWVEVEHDDLRQFKKMTRRTNREMAESLGISNLNVLSTLGGRPIGHMLISAHFTVLKPLPVPYDPRHLNKSINALAKPGYLRPWFGPVVIFADGRRLGEQVAKFFDISPRDVHSTVRLFEMCDCTCVPNPERFPGEVIAGLKINDLKSELNKASGVKIAFEPVQVPLAPTECHDYAVAMAFHLGLRWYIRHGHYVSNNGTGGTFWSDGSLRYVACVVKISEIQLGSGNNTLDVPGTEKAKARGFDPMFEYGPFLGSPVLLHGSGAPVDMHHLHAFNSYLDQVYITKGAASKADFVKFWAEYKTRTGGTVASVPSPYKWEKKSVVDRLGIYNPEFVMAIVECRVHQAWGFILKCMNEVRVKDLGRPRR